MTKEIITVIDYGSGNLRSAAKACEHAADMIGLETEVIISDKASDIEKSSHIILPGQGAFGDCINGLKNHAGLIDALEEAVIKNQKPFLGICVGMQLLATRGLEHGTHEGLGWIEGEVVALSPSDKSLKIPHMGWNDTAIHQPTNPLAKDIKEGEHFYYVHSYHMMPSNPADNLFMSCDYGGQTVAAVLKDNIVGVQFHVEKSGDAGLRFMSNFLRWNP